MPSAFVLSQAEIENELRKHGSGFEGGKQRIMALYQTQPDRNLRVKALAKEYGIGGHSHDYLDGSRGFVNHDGIFEICILFFLHWNHHFFDKIRSHHFPTAIRLGFLMLFQHILHL